MPVEMKKEIRKRVACMIGTTQEAIRKAEAECDGRLYMGPIDATLADRLSYDLEEGEEFRREIEPAWRQVDAAWRIWQEKHVIAKENLLQAEALLQSLIELFKGFTYKEMDQALHYVMKHHLKPVRVMKEEGLIE